MEVPARKRQEPLNAALRLGSLSMNKRQGTPPARKRQWLLPPRKRQEIQPARRRLTKLRSRALHPASRRQSHLTSSLRQGGIKKRLEELQDKRMRQGLTPQKRQLETEAVLRKAAYLRSRTRREQQKRSRNRHSSGKPFDYITFIEYMHAFRLVPC